MSEEQPVVVDQFGSPDERTSRRRLLLRLCGGGGAFVLLSAIGVVPLTNVIATNDGDNSGPGGGGDDETPAITGEVPAGSVEIRIVDDDPGGFVPSEVTVNLGQSVTFVNAHHDEHTATGSGFDTGIIQSGDTATIVLDEPGKFVYACQIHPEMTGSIAVRNAEGEVPEDATPEASPSPSPADLAAATIVIRNFAFDPPSIEVHAGTTVTWRNEDAAAHTATAIDGSFDSGQLDQGQEREFTFDHAGTFDYRCDFHPQMQGTVNVN